MVSVPMHVLRICSCGIFAYPRCIHDLRHGVLSLLQTGVHVRLGVIILETPEPRALESHELTGTSTELVADGFNEAGEETTSI